MHEEVGVGNSREPESRIQLVSVTSREELPTHVAHVGVFDDRTNQCCAETRAAVTGKHEHVGEPRVCGQVGDHSSETDLFAVVGVGPYHEMAVRERLFHHSAAPARGPVRLAGEITMHDIEVDEGRVGADRVPTVAEFDESRGHPLSLADRRDLPATGIRSPLSHHEYREPGPRHLERNVTMRRVATLFIPIVLFTAACAGGDDAASNTDDTTTSAGSGSSTDSAVDVDGNVTGDSTDDSESTEGPPDGLPAECVETPFDIDVSLDAVTERSGTFTVEGAAGTATPVVPNGDGSLDTLDPAEFERLGSETSILAYAQWVGNFPFGPDDIGFLGGPETPAGGVTLALSVTATSDTGLAAGDIIDDSDELEYNSITTFASVGVYYQPEDSSETWFLVDNLDDTQGGTAEILYVDADWLCVDWNLAGETRDPDGRYEISGVVLTPVERLTTPFT